MRYFGDIPHGYLGEKSWIFWPTPSPRLSGRVWAVWVGPPSMPRGSALGWMVLAPHEGSRDSGGGGREAPLHAPWRPIIRLVGGKVITDNWGWEAHLSAPHHGIHSALVSGTTGLRVLDGVGVWLRREQEQAFRTDFFLTTYESGPGSERWGREGEGVGGVGPDFGGARLGAHQHPVFEDSGPRWVTVLFPPGCLFIVTGCG